MVVFESYLSFGLNVARVGSLNPGDDSTECQCMDCREKEALKTGIRSKFDEEARQNGDWEDG